jgi:hypothetical protein
MDLVVATQVSSLPLMEGMGAYMFSLGIVALALHTTVGFAVLGLVAIAMMLHSVLT